jgi:GNAT superfamily N-acetyltransferase
MVLQETLHENLITIEPLSIDDIPKLVPILKEHVRDRDTGVIVQDEIDNIQTWMYGEEDQQHHRSRHYLVARDESGQVLGCIGYTDPAKYHLDHHHIPADESIEVVNFFVGKSAQGRGVGRQLFNAVVAKAKQTGKKHLVLDSGPRYKNAWPVYEKIFGYEGTWILDLYDPGIHAKTWKMEL